MMGDFGSTIDPTSDGLAPLYPTGSGLERRAPRAAWFAERFEGLQSNVEGFIRGKSSAVRFALICMMGEGHLLVDDIPGVGKTSLAKALALSIDGSMARIQFTPDLLPSDVTGSQVWNAGRNEFEFRPGPVFAHIVVGDEINRASPKTQSSLLEVMEERQVTVDGTPHPVPRPFMVIATQNPVEFEGTYHLPEAQIDRFMMRISIGYPDHDAEVEVIRGRSTGHTVDDVKPVMDLATARTMTSIASETHVAPAIHSYIVTICAATRRLSELRLGVSPRGTLAVVITAQANAASQGRDFVTVDDVKAVAPYVLTHRMLLTPESELRGQSASELLERIIASVPVPDTRIER